MGVRAKKIRGGGGQNNFAQHKQKLPDFICLKHCTLDITTCSLCAYSKGILLVCALQIQNYPFETNKPNPIARLSSKNCPTFTISPPPFSPLPPPPSPPGMPMIQRDISTSLLFWHVVYSCAAKSWHSAAKSRIFRTRGKSWYIASTDSILS